MPEPEDQAAQPQPLVPEDAIPGDVSAEDAIPGSVSAEDNSPAPVAAADNGIPDPARSDNDASGVPAGSAAEAASADDATSADDADLAEDDIPAEQMPQGLRWSWDLDFDTLIAALSEPAPCNRPVRPAVVRQHYGTGCSPVAWDRAGTGVSVAVADDC